MAKLFQRFLIVILIIFVPLLCALFANYSTIETPRLNLQRAAIETSFYLDPTDSFQYEFESTMDGLSKVKWFMRPDVGASWFDQYDVSLMNIDSGEQFGESTLRNYSLWDDVATIHFDPIENSEGESFLLVIKPDSSNGSAIELAMATDEPDFLILQPYYKTTAFFEAVWIVGADRLSWRLIPLLFLIPLLMIFVSPYTKR